MQCPSCSRIKGVKSIDMGIYECPKCNAIFGSCYLGDSYKYVLPYFDESPNPIQERYFDFTCAGSKGITRRHGWFNPKTKCLTQVG